MTKKICNGHENLLYTFPSSECKTTWKCQSWNRSLTKTHLNSKTIIEKYVFLRLWTLAPTKKCRWGQIRWKFFPDFLDKKHGHQNSKLYFWNGCFKINISSKWRKYETNFILSYIDEMEHFLMIIVYYSHTTTASSI